VHFVGLFSLRPYLHSYPQIHITTIIVSLESFSSKFISLCTLCHLRTEGWARYFQVTFHLFYKLSQGENIVCHKVWKILNSALQPGKSDCRSLAVEAY